MTDRRDQPTRELGPKTAERAEAPTRIPSGEAPVSSPPPIERATLAPSALQVVDVIGIGGMGVVYRATQTELDRPIAYKRLIRSDGTEFRPTLIVSWSFSDGVHVVKGLGPKGATNHTTFYDERLEPVLVESKDEPLDCAVKRVAPERFAVSCRPLGADGPWQVSLWRLPKVELASGNAINPYLA